MEYHCVDIAVLVPVGEDFEVVYSISSPHFKIISNKKQRKADKTPKVATLLPARCPPCFDDRAEAMEVSSILALMKNAPSSQETTLVNPARYRYDIEHQHMLQMSSHEIYAEARNYDISASSTYSAVGSVSTTPIGIQENIGEYFQSMPAKRARVEYMESLSTLSFPALDDRYVFLPPTQI